MKDYHFDNKIAAGPGGIRCPCCNFYHVGHSQKATKAKINRHSRRKLRLVLKGSQYDIWIGV